MRYSTTPNDLIPLFTAELELCKVQPAETVAIYTENDVRLDYAAAFTAAAITLGATVFTVNVPARGRALQEIAGRAAARGLEGNRVLVEALKQCDIVIDLCPIMFEPEQYEIRSSGTRVLTCMEPPDTLARMFPTLQQKKHALEARDLLSRASALCVRSDAGTDISYDLGQYAVRAQYGIADEPGRWDHFVSSLTAVVGNDSGVNGTIVVDIGDIISPYPHYVRQPVHITVRDGFVERIEGGLEAVFIRDEVQAHDRNAYAMSHVGWGFHPAARWESLQLNPNQLGMDARSFAGGVLLSTGPNIEFNGTNDTPSHWDFAMRNCSLWVDDELIVDRGRLVWGKLW
jgi:2,5-dihydroxypyridine 5,6-dioxygenase